MPKPIQINENNKQWFIFPDSLPTGQFKGYETRGDETKNRGTFPIGQNVMFDNGIPMVRFGFEVIGTEAVDATPVKKAWVYETRTGVQFELKTYNTGVYYFLVGTSTEFSLLKGGFTASQEFSFANIGQSADTTGLCFFCNGTENPFKWTGAYATISSTTVNTITKTGTSTWASEGFPATGTVIINGTEYTYTGGTGTTTLTGVAGDPTGEANGSLVVHSPIELTGVVGGGTDPDKFSIAMAHDGRLHFRRESKKSVWVYSKLDNPDDITTGASDGDGGAKEIEFGGPIVAFSKLNKTAICFKKRLIKVLDFIQVGSRLDSPRYQTLTSGDDKGTTLGATNQKSTFSTPIGTVFVTQDKRMMLLTGITQNNEPQYIELSNPIQSVFDQGIHDEGAGICFNNTIYYSFKSDINSTTNDVVIRGDLTQQTIDENGRAIPIQWDTPYIGINANDWSIIYNSTNKENELHFHSSLNSNTYKIIDDKTDGSQAFTSILRTWSETFGFPTNQKRIDSAFIEIRMTENSESTATLLYDEDGVTAQTEYTLDGDDTDNLFNNQTYNPFGASQFGSQKIGSNPNIMNLKKYRYELEVNPNIRFFNLALQLSLDGEAYDFELVRFGFRVVEVIVETDRQYKKA